MKAILTDAADIGAVTVGAIACRIRDDDAFLCAGSDWHKPFFGGYKFETAPGVSNPGGAIFFCEIATGVPTAMAEKMVGQGAQYPWTALDSTGRPFDGGNTCRLRLPPDIPVRDFWSVIVCDAQTRSMLQTSRSAPGVSGQDRDVKVNAAGAVDVWFGPAAPAGREHNSLPGRGWFTIRRALWPAGAVV